MNISMRHTGLNDLNGRANHPSDAHIGHTSVLSFLGDCAATRCNHIVTSVDPLDRLGWRLRGAGKGYAAHFGQVLDGVRGVELGHYTCMCKVLDLLGE